MSVWFEAQDRLYRPTVSLVITSLAVGSPVSLLGLLGLRGLLSLLSLLAVLSKLLAAVLGVPLPTVVWLLLLVLLVAAAAAESLPRLEGLRRRLEGSSTGPEPPPNVHLLLGLAGQVLVLGSRVILPRILNVVGHVDKGARGSSGAWCLVSWLVRGLSVEDLELRLTDCRAVGPSFCVWGCGMAVGFAW